MKCSACRDEITGDIGGAIHRDGFGEGPEVVLCEPCGGHELPTCEQLWARIAVHEADGVTFDHVPEGPVAA